MTIGRKRVDFTKLRPARESSAPNVPLMWWSCALLVRGEPGLVAVKGGAAPSDKLSCGGSTFTAGPGCLDDCELLCDLFRGPVQ